jgi:hypothetical protein
MADGFGTVVMAGAGGPAHDCLFTYGARRWLAFLAGEMVFWVGLP